MDYVRRRGKIYWAVITVPGDLQGIVGRKQIWRSLKTSRYETAKSYARQLLNHVDKLFHGVRCGMIDGRTVNAMVAEFALGELRSIDRERLRSLIATCNYDTQEAIAKVYANLAELCRRGEVQQLHLKDLDAVELAVLYLERYSKCELLDGSNITKDDIKQVVTEFAIAKRLLFKVHSEHILGITEFESDFQYRLLERWRADLPVKNDKGIPFSDLQNLYFEHWKQHFRGKPDRIQRKESALKRIGRLIHDYFGPDIGAKEINESNAIDWRNFVQEDSEVSNNTININYLEHLTAMFSWAMETPRNYLDYNPWAKIRLPAGAEREKSRVFSDDELQQYINLLGETYLPGSPEKTWIPLIMLYSGMRNNEVCQLYVNDVQVREGIPYFHITDNADRNQRVKGPSSRRDLPIHPKLIELGLLEHVGKMKRAGEIQVFPNCAYNERTGRYYDDNLSARLNAIVDCVSDDRKLRVYSLRANFKTSIENKFADAAVDAMEGRGSAFDLGALSKFVDRAFDDVMGHAVKGSKGDTVYRKVQLRVMRRVVEQAEYSVNLSTLKETLKIN